MARNGLKRPLAIMDHNRPPMNSPRNAPSGAAPSLNAKTLVFVFGPTAAFARGEADDRRWPDEIDAAFYSEMSSTAAEAIKAAATPEWGQPRIMSGHVGVGDHTCPCYRLGKPCKTAST